MSRNTDLLKSIGLFSCLLIALLHSTYVNAQGVAVKEINFDQFKDGFLLLQTSNETEAARVWMTLSQSGDEVQILPRAFAAVLASIAYQRNNDSTAYTAWGHAIQLFLRAGSTWELSRAQFSQLYQDTRQSLSQNVAQGAGPSPSVLTMIAIEETLHLSTYMGPVANLSQIKTPSRKDRVTISKNFYARPMTLVESSSQDSDSDNNRSAPDLSTQRTTTQSSTVSNSRAITPGERDTKPTPVKEPQSTTAAIIPPRGAPVATLSTQSTRTADNESVANAQRTMRPIASNVTDRLAVPDGKTQTTSEATIQRLISRGSQPNDEPRPATSQQQDTQSASAKPTPDPVVPRASILTEQDMQIATIAWQYFENQRMTDTGLVSSVQGYGRGNMWDIGSTIAALISAQVLGIISRRDFDDWMLTLLATLADLPLYNDEVPNTEYAFDTGMMIGTNGGTDAIGKGWSAKDIGRTLIWLHILQSWYSDYDDQISRIVSRWRFNRVIQNGRLFSVTTHNGLENVYEESRLGYNQYAALGYALWEYDMTKALVLSNYDNVTLHGVTLSYDTRENSYLTSDPFILMGMEVSDPGTQLEKLKNRVYDVHKAQWLETGLLMVMNEDALNHKPWYLYNSIYYLDRQWTCFNKPGKHYPNCQALSVKGAFGWYAFGEDDFTKALLQQVSSLSSSNNGYQTGLFADGTINDAITLNTNAVILETMLFRKRGKVSFSRSLSSNNLSLSSP